MGIRLSIGNDFFARLRDEGCYYVDKTGIIEKILEYDISAYLITRPRRFGKTLTMTMFEDFLDISRDSRARFADLKVAKNAELCQKWQNQWPVVFLSLKKVEGSDFQTAYGALEMLISELCMKYSFLGQSDKVGEADKKTFENMISQNATPKELCGFFYTITRMMAAHYGKQCILLIDEYDVPLAKASENGYYKEMLDVLRTLFGALKTNEHLKLALVTGCLRIAKESIFTGMNNFVVDTITGERLDEYIGFTDEDVRGLLSAAGLSDHMEELRQWYDGYHFGKVGVYCPWDVVNHVAALMENPAARPRDYWCSTSHNGVIYNFISRENLNVNDKFETLMAGGTLVERITENLTYDMLDSSEENLWSLLFMTGYLTLGELPEGYTVQNPVQEVPLRIPNEEIKMIFKNTIVAWFNQTVQNADRTKLFEAFWGRDVKTASELVSDLLFDTISYYDYQESYYHAFVAEMFAGAGYIVESNYERGKGRPDIVIKDKKNRRALVIEIKYTKNEDELQARCDEAIRQLIDKKYAWGLEKGYREVICYGAAFCEKECVIREAE